MCLFDVLCLMIFNVFCCFCRKFGAVVLRHRGGRWAWQRKVPTCNMSRRTTCRRRCLWHTDKFLLASRRVWTLVCAAAIQPGVTPTHGQHEQVGAGDTKKTKSEKVTEDRDAKHKTRGAKQNWRAAQSGVVNAAHQHDLWWACRSAVCTGTSHHRS